MYIYIVRLIQHLRDLALRSPAKAAVCVGHSMLFRRIFRRVFAKNAGGGGGWADSPLGRMLQEHVLANCGVAALDLDSNGAIIESRLLFGSGFRIGHVDPAED